MAKKTIGWTIFGTIAGIIIVSSFFSSNEDFSSNLPQNDPTQISDQFSNVKELHFTHMPITYQIINNEAYCNPIQISHMIKGLEIVENLSEGKVVFQEISNGADLVIECISPLVQTQKIEKLREEATLCKNVSFNYSVTSINWYTSEILNKDTQWFVSARTLERDKNHTLYELCYADISDNTTLGQERNKANRIIPDSDVMGDATPNIQEGVILGGKINLYQEGEGFSRCSFPAKEIHELFHVFGFDHTPEPRFDPYLGYIVHSAYDAEFLRDIMRPHIDCSQLTGINPKYISCLKKIYSNQELINENCEGVNFMQVNYSCSEGWYSVDGTDYCCSEPNMKIVNGYCSK